MNITNMTRIKMIQPITSRLGDAKARAGIWQLQKGQVADEYVISHRPQVNEDVPKNFRAANESLPQFRQTGIPLDWPHLGHLPFIGWKESHTPPNHRKSENAHAEVGTLGAG